MATEAKRPIDDYACHAIGDVESPNPPPQLLPGNAACDLAMAKIDGLRKDSAREKPFRAALISRRDLAALKQGDARITNCRLTLSLFSVRTSRIFPLMSFLDLEQLPFVGISHEFVGETQGAPFSAYIVKAKPGQGPPLHKHPYVEVVFTIEGCATITVGDEEREVQTGGIVVIPAGCPHRFVNSGDTTLRQIDIHSSPRFIQTNLS